MKFKIKKINLISNPETLGTVHTCSFIGLNNAIFAFINIVEKTDYEFCS